MFNLRRSSAWRPVFEIWDETTGFASEELAETLNSPALLLDRLSQCQTLHGRRPSFVSVDFVDVAKPIVTLRKLNRGEPVDVSEPSDVRDN